MAFRWVSSAGVVWKISVCVRGGFALSFCCHLIVFLDCVCPVWGRHGIAGLMKPVEKCPLRCSPEAAAASSSVSGNPPGLFRLEINWK